MNKPFTPWYSKSQNATRIASSEKLEDLLISIFAQVQMAHPSTLQKNGSKFAFCLNFFARYSKMTVQVIKATGIKKKFSAEKKNQPKPKHIFFYFDIQSILSFATRLLCSPYITRHDVQPWSYLTSSSYCSIQL